MTVIELGDLASGSPQRPAREFDPRTGQRYVAALLIVICLVTLAGSVRPEPVGVRALWSVPQAYDGRFTVGAGVVVATTASGQLDGYDLHSGRKRWSSPMLEPNVWPDVAGDAGVVLLATDRYANQSSGADGNQYMTEYYRGTVGLDLHDGHRRWRATGTELARAAGTVLLVDYTGNGSSAKGFRVVRLRDGGVLWSGPATAPVHLATAGADPRRPDRVVTVTGDGTTVVYGWADGRELARGRVAWQEVEPGDGQTDDLFADGVNVYVRHADSVSGSLAAYALDRVTPRWTAPNAAQLNAFACGAIVCVFEPASVAEPSSFAAYDPTSGRPKWRQVGLAGVTMIGSDRLLAEDGIQDAWAIYDALGGRVRAHFGAGSLVRDEDTEQVLLTLPTVDPPLRTSISRIDLDTGERSLRGSVERVGDFGCLLSGGYLICNTMNGRLSVSRVAP